MKRLRKGSMSHGLVEQSFELKQTDSNACHSNNCTKLLMVWVPYREKFSSKQTVLGKALALS